MKLKNVYLVRHGEIVNDGIRRFIGQIDVPLSDQGLNQAYHLRDELSCSEIDAIFCSDLGRVLSTTRIIAGKHDVEPVIRRDLREISLGSWEGLAIEEVKRLYPGEYKKRGDDIYNYKTPGGESFAECAKRVLPAFEAMLSSTANNILIVGHAGINRLIICDIMGIAWKNLFSIPQDYGCLNVLSYCDYGWRVKQLNCFHFIGSVLK